MLAFGVPAGLAWALGTRWLVGVMVLHALVSEPLQQALAPARLMELGDLAADLVGIALGVACAAAILRRRRHDGGMAVNVDQARPGWDDAGRDDAGWDDAERGR